jgi:hypothetical protein
MITLQITYAFCADQRRVFGILDTFSYRHESKALHELSQIMQEDLLLLALCEVADKRAIDLDSVDRQDLKMSQRGVAGPEIVESDAAARVMQRVDKACRLIEIVECCSFSDFHYQAASEFGPIAQQQNQGVEPPPVTGRQTGYIESEPYFGVVGEFPHRLFENIAVDKTNQAQLLDRRDEIAASDDAAFQVAHSQQALEIVHFSCRRADHRLEGKEQPIVAQCRLNCRAYRQAVSAAIKLNLVFALAHRLFAPQLAFTPQVRSPGGSLMLTGAQQNAIAAAAPSAKSLNHRGVKQASEIDVKSDPVSFVSPVSMARPAVT